MQPAICLLAVVPMRKEPSHRSEMVSQLLFGEFVLLGEEKDDFVFVKCDYDSYEGWVQANQLTPVNETYTTENYVGCWTNEALVNGWYQYIPMCSPVYRNETGVFRFGDKDVKYLLSHGCLWNTSEHQQLTMDELQKVYDRFIYTPYLWGGKSVFGIDCSGFVQQVFKMFGKKLLRDAYLQGKQGEEVEALEAAQLGDLAFFQNENGRITHVGILLPDSQIVHASGRVRIDTIDDKGIINSESGRRTHYTHSIRRFF